MKSHRIMKFALSLMSLISIPVFADVPEQPLSSDVQTYSSVKAILTDIEGTTTSISFVHDELFPYAKTHVAEYLQDHHTEGNVSKLIEEVKEIANAPDATLDEVSAILLSWMNQDKKITPLKALQGLMWQEGYESGAFQGHVYADAYDQMKRWHSQGLPIYVYSSGSVQAQKLLYSHSTFGDLTPLFSGNFDTKIGMKKDSSSYTAIAEQMGIAPESILFLSDTLDELVAARAAGMQVVMLCRDGAPTVNCYPIYPTAETFNQINIE